MDPSAIRTRTNSTTTPMASTTVANTKLPPKSSETAPTKRWSGVVPFYHGFRIGRTGDAVLRLGRLMRHQRWRAHRLSNDRQDDGDGNQKTACNPDIIQRLGIFYETATGAGHDHLAIHFDLCAVFWVRTELPQSTHEHQDGQHPDGNACDVEAHGQRTG